MRAYAPNGSLIVGTAETTPTTAKIDPDSFGEGGGGPRHTGETRVYPGGQRQKRGPGGDLLYVDQEGRTWERAELTVGPEAASVEVKEKGAGPSGATRTKRVTVRLNNVGPLGEPFARHAIIRRAAEKLGLRVTPSDLWLTGGSREWHISIQEEPPAAEGKSSAEEPPARRKTATGGLRREVTP